MPAGMEQLQAQMDAAAGSGDEATLRRLLLPPPRDLRYGCSLQALVRRGHIRALRVLAAAAAAAAGDGDGLAEIWGGETALHAAADANSAGAARVLLALGGARLLLRAWSDPREVFDQLLRRSSPMRGGASHEAAGEAGGEGVGEPAPRRRVGQLELLHLARALGSPDALLQAEHAVGPLPSSSEEDEEGGHNAAGRGGDGSGGGHGGVGVGMSWFVRFWGEHRPVSSPLCIAADIGHAEVLGVMLDAVARGGAGMHWCAGVLTKVDPCGAGWGRDAERETPRACVSGGTSSPGASTSPVRVGTRRCCGSS
jgi:hypothetical protein